MVELHCCGACGWRAGVYFAAAGMADGYTMHSSALHRMFIHVSLKERDGVMKIVVIRPSKFWGKILKSIFKI